MNNFFVFLILIFMMSSPVFSATITGGVSYTVESARIESFDGVPLKISTESYSDKFVDVNYEKNMKYLENNRSPWGVKLTKFSDGTYAVEYKNKKGYGYYYSNKGILELIEIDKFIDERIRKNFRYDINGDLDSVSLICSGNEQYIFGVSKNLIAHWIGDNCYNEKGELIHTRY